MKTKKAWIAVIALMVLVGAGYLLRAQLIPLISGQAGTTVRAQGPGGGFDAASATTTAIRPASEADQVSAAGNIALSSQRPVVLQVEGMVSQVAVEVGDEVAADDLLVALDTADLERAVKQAELSLASAQAQLDELLEPAGPAEIASAQASLASAQQDLAEVRAGPSQAELAAAQAKLAGAQASYQELRDGPSDAELTQLGADLEKAMITLQQAQWDYDKVAYQGEGASSQAAALQQATIDYDAAKAAYDITTQPASASELQNALSEIQTAQDELDTLRSQPTLAEIAAAEAEVASAQSQLDALLNGSGDAERRAAEISVEQARLDLEVAQAELAQAQLRAPLAGTVLSVDVEVGQQVSGGTTALTLTDLSQLELTVNVAEVDVDKLKPGQVAHITVDAQPDKAFQGTITRIAPSSDPESGVVNYPVTVQLTSADLVGVRPGMTAVAAFVGEELADTWLVPTSALAERGGKTVVMILRDDRPAPIEVARQGSQGEWTVVQSAELQAGDEALGEVSSFLDQENTFRGFGPPGGGVMIRERAPGGGPQ